MLEAAEHGWPVSTGDLVEAQLIVADARERRALILRRIENRAPLIWPALAALAALALTAWIVAQAVL